jgi:CRP/FNR family transcriptional regulator, dissimilatory nitrate respiration regulator
MRKFQSTLKALPLFADNTFEENALILSNSRIISCHSGKLLFSHGDKVTHFYVICRGAMQIFRDTPDGYEATCNILISGDSVNADELVSCQAKHAMSARAVNDCSLLEIPISWMLENFNNMNNMAAKLLAGLAAQLSNAQVDIEHLSTMSAAQNAACYLQKLRVQYNFDPLEFELPYTKSLIASRLQMGRETFSRSLLALKDHGISVTGARVSFKDMHKTRRFVCDKCSVSNQCKAYQDLHQDREKISAHGT